MMYTIHTDRQTPLSYSLYSHWLLGLNISTWNNDMSNHAHITFSPDEKSHIDIPLPDIVPHRHSIYFGLYAYSFLSHMLERHGSFIRVYADDHIGYVFSPRIIVEHKTPRSLFFEAKNTLIFRSIRKNSSTIFCHQRLKDMLEKIPLTGCTFIKNNKIVI